MILKKHFGRILAVKLVSIGKNRSHVNTEKSESYFKGLKLFKTGFINKIFFSQYK